MTQNPARNSLGAIVLAALVALAQAQTRTFHLVNNCAETVWFQATSGAAPYSGGGPCSSNSGCVQGSSCNTQNGICFWNVPTPSTGVFRLEPNGGTNSLVFPFYAGNEVVWSGNIGGCVNGTCAQSAASCDAAGCGTYAASPETKAEWTLSRTGTDFYDVEVINGFNLPLAVYPRNANLSASDPYRCGSPGAPAALTQTGNSTWVFELQSVYHNWVATGGVGCASNSDCAAFPGTVCGLSNNVGQSPRLRLTCGVLHGHWTANQVCGIDQSFGAPFNCAQALSSPNSPSDTHWNLYACNGGLSASCYQQGAATSCCGCANWDTLGIFVPPTTTQCVNTNPNWVSLVRPELELFKGACPTCYTYPYDDMSSTFVCRVDNGAGLNVLNYDVVWCPDAGSAAPETNSRSSAPTQSRSADQDAAAGVSPVGWWVAVGLGIVGAALL